MTDTRRVFFALWPDEKLRQAVQKQFRQTAQYHLHGKRMLPSNLHLTLHFIGNVDAETLQCLAGAAKNVQAGSFSLSLDCYGHFGRAQTLWLGCHDVPPALQALQQELGLALQPCGYIPEDRAFTPHVTLMRKMQDPGVLEPVEPMNWQVNSFALVESVAVPQGVQYRPIEKYLLTKLDVR